MKKRVLVGMSGGVDSSVAAAMLLNQGYEVGGITMKLAQDDDPEADLVARSRAAVDDAAAVAQTLSIPHHVADVADYFGDCVVGYFVDEYKRGRTPNPCIQCNLKLKFGLLLQKARELGYDYLATGHYATIENGYLRRGADRSKDQSYFLYVLYEQNAIERVLFPLAELNKPVIREMAASMGLPTASRSDSQDICFVPDGNYAALIGRRGTQPIPGDIVDLAGKVIGTHQGIWHYTIGQRKGLGALGKRMFVREIQPENNRIVAAENHQLMSSYFTIKDCIVHPDGLRVGEKYESQVRYRSRAVGCKIAEYSPDQIRVVLDQPQRAVAPGQSAVLYKGDTVMGGGIIDEIQ